MKALLFFSWISFCLCAQNSLVPFIQPCHLGDNECLLRSTKLAVPWLIAGVPALDIIPLDPLHLKRVKTTRSGLNMDFRNTVCKGLKTADVFKIEYDGNRLDISLRCSVVLTGDYTFSGQLLIMPINGDGKYRTRIRDLVLKVAVDLAERESNGSRYWNIEKWTYQHHVETGVDFRFQNLFNGNKQLADAIQRFASSNWRVIFEETAPPVVDEAVSQIVQQISKLFVKVPIKDLIVN